MGSFPGVLDCNATCYLDGLDLRLGTHRLPAPSLIEPSCCRAWTTVQDEDGSSWSCHRLQVSLSRADLPI